jgi:hypothetical protein
MCGEQLAVLGMFDVRSDMDGFARFALIRVSLVHYASAFMRGFSSALGFAFMSVRSGSCTSELFFAASFEK